MLNLLKLKQYHFNCFKTVKDFLLLWVFYLVNLNLISVGDGFKGLLLTGIILGPKQDFFYDGQMFSLSSFWKLYCINFVSLCNLA